MNRLEEFDQRVQSSVPGRAVFAREPGLGVQHTLEKEIRTPMMKAAKTMPAEDLPFSDFSEEKQSNIATFPDHTGLHRRLAPLVVNANMDAKTICNNFRKPMQFRLPYSPDWCLYMLSRQIKIHVIDMLLRTCFNSTTGLACLQSMMLKQ